MTTSIMPLRGTHAPAWWTPTSLSANPSTSVRGNTHARRLQRRVANDAFVDVDTVRYSVPYRLVRDHVEVLVAAAEVRVYHGQALVAVHARSSEPHARVVDSAHFQGLWRTPENVVPLPQPLAALGRSLDDYAAVVGGAA